MLELIKTVPWAVRKAGLPLENRIGCGNLGLGLGQEICAGAEKGRRCGLVYQPGNILKGVLQDAQEELGWSRASLLPHSGNSSRSCPRPTTASRGRPGPAAPASQHHVW